MKITIIGSWRQEEEGTWGLKNRKGFEPYCLELGREMAKRKHVLIVGNNLVQTADRLVVQGYEREGSGPGCEVFDNTGDAPIPQAAHIKAGNLSQGVIIVGGASGSYVAGLALLNSPRRFIPVSCFGGAARRLLPELLRSAPIEGFSNEDTDFRLRLAKLAEQDITDQSLWPELARITLDLLDDFPRILVIHGRGRDRDELKEFLQKELSPPVQNVIVMKETPGASTAAPRKFERLARAVDAAIAVVTPDDIGAAVINRAGDPIKAYELGKFSPRARENVWLEIGWFWGSLGRDRLLILRRGDAVIPPSDLGGVWAESYDEKFKDSASAKEEVKRFIANLRGARDKGAFKRGNSQAKGEITDGGNGSGLIGEADATAPAPRKTRAASNSRRPRTSAKRR